MPEKQDRNVPLLRIKKIRREDRGESYFGPEDLLIG
jgi:hypothetical protein